MLNPMQEAFVKDAIELGKREIQLEIAIGRIPPTVVEFAELHNYVDANCFGGLCDDERLDALVDRETNEGSEVFCEIANQVQAALDAWLRHGMDRNALLVQRLVEQALNAACKTVQDELGQATGDVADRFFSGDQGALINGVLARYVLVELTLLQNPLP